MVELRRLTKLVAVLALLVVPLMAEAQTGNGCAGLRRACEAAGFINTEDSSKNTKIIRDCMTPLLNGSTPPGNGTVALPEVGADVLAACQTVKAKRGKASTGETATIKRAGSAPVTVKALPAGTNPGPNIIYILADDFSMDLMTTENNVLAEAMPNLAAMMREGMTFSNYFVSNSLCCPSRSTIFTGMFPHNTHVLANSGPDGGLTAFNLHNNDARTFGVALHNGYYATGMMGKYLNGYRTAMDAPQGWSEWAVGDNGYSNLNYTLNHNGTLTSPALYMTDELSRLAQEFITNAAPNPFFLEIATFAPHAPYTPPVRYADAFPGLTYPKSPAYAARPDENAPTWLREMPTLDKRFDRKVDENYRLRVQSIKGIDDLIGDIRAKLEVLGLAEDTYVIFNSDNGYHMGDYSLRPGKTTPFDVDTNVPLIVVGPGVVAGKTVDDIAQNIDLYPTFVEMAGLPASATVDGQSLLGVMKGEASLNRTIAVIEHTRTAFAADDPDALKPEDGNHKAGDPPDYVALRMRDALYVEYLDGSGEISYYDLKSDPYQLRNIAPTLPAARLKALHDAAVANQTCSGVKECTAAQSLTP